MSCSTESMLHITNGDSVQLAAARVPGEILVWADPLHEGPVPEGLDLDRLSAVRGHFLTGREDAFHSRDAVLKRYADHDEIVLWFEHDLFDQLLLIQLLDWFHRADLTKTELSLIQSGEYLGHMSPARLASLLRGRKVVASAQFDVAVQAWSAFRSSSPEALLAISGADTSSLPWLAGAIHRFLEHYPDVTMGLSRTERQILQHSAAGIHEPAELFRADQRREDRIFMGDSTFFGYLRGLMEAKVPLLGPDGTITETGQKVLDGLADAIELNGIDRWLGGVHLNGQARHWRWDAELEKLRLA